MEEEVLRKASNPTENGHSVDRKSRNSKTARNRAVSFQTTEKGEKSEKSGRNRV